VCCSALQCVAVCCSALQCVAVCCSVWQCVAVWCCVLSVLQCVAVCCSVLQCVAVCCSVLQCSHKRDRHDHKKRHAHMLKDFAKQTYKKPRSLFSGERRIKKDLLKRTTEETYKETCQHVRRLLTCAKQTYNSAVFLFKGDLALCDVSHPNECHHFTSLCETTRLIKRDLYKWHDSHQKWPVKETCEMTQPISKETCKRHVWHTATHCKTLQNTARHWNL